jgi:hypothetical protein
MGSLSNDHGVIFQTINTLDVLSTISGGVRQKTGMACDVDLLFSLTDY